MLLIKNWSCYGSPSLVWIRCVTFLVQDGKIVKIASEITEEGAEII